MTEPEVGRPGAVLSDRLSYFPQQVRLFPATDGIGLAFAAINPLQNVMPVLKPPPLATRVQVALAGTGVARCDSDAVVMSARSIAANACWSKRRCLTKCQTKAKKR